MSSNGKRMVKEDLINYLEEVQTNYPDPSDIGGGTDFTATNGLLLQEIEGENYLGIDPSANIKGQLVFTTTNSNIPAITINTGMSTNTDIKFNSVYDNGENNDKGRLRYVQGLNGHFELGSMINGDYATVKTPNANTLLDDGEWPTTRTIGVGAKVGSTTVYAGNDGVIDLSSQITPSKKFYSISFAPNDEEKNVNVIGISDVELEEPDMDTLFSYYDEYTSGQYSGTTQEIYQEQIDKLANVLASLKQVMYQDYKPLYYNDNSSTPGTISNLVLSINVSSAWKEILLYENGTVIVDINITKSNNVNHLDLTFDDTKLNYMYTYVQEI